MIKDKDGMMDSLSESSHKSAILENAFLETTTTMAVVMRKGMYAYKKKRCRDI